jgi:Importin-beta N-terminal domain
MCSGLKLPCICVQRAAAETILKQLQAHQDAWQRVDVILEQSQNQQTKFLAMQVSVERAKWHRCAVCLCSLECNFRCVMGR